MESAAPRLANSLASLAAGRFRLRRARSRITRSNPRASRTLNASRHSRRSAVSRARASATAGARCRTRQDAFTCRRSSSVNAAKSTTPDSATPGASSRGVPTEASRDTRVVCVLMSRGGRASAVDGSAPATTKRTSPSLAAFAASALARANGRNGMSTASAASECSVCAFFLRATARNASSAPPACFAASRRRAGITTRLPRVSFEGRRAWRAADGDCEAAAGLAGGRAAKKRDTTLVCGRVVRGWWRSAGRRVRSSKPRDFARSE